MRAEHMGFAGAGKGSGYHNNKPASARQADAPPHHKKLADGCAAAP
ncbi:hypothetical protein [Lacrimispora sp. 210928-DFI.3.58]|nr:hypothetical protein [Lacrimispora sp. 210928-DFI.3.58]